MTIQKGGTLLDASTSLRLLGSRLGLATEAAPDSYTLHWCTADSLFHLLPGLYTTQTHCAQEPQSVCYASHCWPSVSPLAWSLHRADILCTHFWSVVWNGAHRERPSLRIVSQQLNTNLHLATLYDFQTLINIVYVLYCDCHYKQSYSIPHTLSTYFIKSKTW